MTSRAKNASFKLIFCGALLAMASAILPIRAVLAADDCRQSPVPGIDWRNCDKSRLMLPGSTLANSNLSEADFSATDLSSSELNGANLEKAKFIRAMLAGSSAKGANLSRIEAYRTDFTGLDAPGASFQNAELQRSNFAKANLSGVDFTKADMGRSQFDGADLSGARFGLANLSRVDFREASFSKPADFDRAFFFLVRIEGLDLSAATGLIQWQVDMACGDEKTKLPSGLKVPASWPCQFQQE